MAAWAYNDLHDTPSALKYAGEADAYKFQNYYAILGSLTDLYVKMQQWDKARDVADRLLALQPSNPRLPQDVMAAYADQPKELQAFFERNLAKYTADTTAHGNLLFHYALYWEDQDQYPKALDNMQLAQKDFERDPKTNAEALQATHSQVARLKEALAQKSAGTTSPAH